MTSLIDVIFLLLLFFMLSSTFSKFSELEISTAASGNGASSHEPPFFLRLSSEKTNLNGREIPFDTLSSALKEEGDRDAPRTLLVSLADDVNAQRLTDLLVILRAVPSVAPTILEQTR